MNCFLYNFDLLHHQIIHQPVDLVVGGLDLAGELLAGAVGCRRRQNDFDKSAVQECHTMCQRIIIVLYIQVP